MNLAGLEVGRDQPCRIVAEIGANHNGDYGLCLRLLEAAKAVGADAVKFQCYLPSELLALRGDGPAPDPWSQFTMRQLYEQARTPLEWFPALAVYASRNLGLPWFASVFGAASLECLEEVQCPAYKIARWDNEAAWLRKLILRTEKPLLVSTNRPLGFRQAHFLYCPSGYPTEAKDVHLPERFIGVDPNALFLGLSSHCLSPELPIAAVARGAKLIEMHLQMADHPSVLDRTFSLGPSQFRDMVQAVRQTEAMLA